MSLRLKYNDEVIAEIQGGQTLILKCKDEAMEHDLVVEDFGGASIVPEWDGSVTKFTDLTGTTWEIPSGWTVEAGLGQFEVNCTYNGTSYNRLGLGYGWEASLQAPFPFNNFALLYNEGTTEYAKLSSGIAYVLSITGGNDVGNPTLMDWLLKYGKLQ